MLRYFALRLLEATTAFFITVFMWTMLTSHPAETSVPKYDTLNLSGPKPDEVYCMAHAIYHEARGEPFIGQVAVAHVIKNRMQKGRWPDHACAVVYQHRQFTDIQQTTPDFDSKQWREALRIAIVVLADLDEDPTSGATHYFAHNKIDPPSWSRKKTVHVRINNHTFLGERL